jgi:hypothetical protein
MLNKILAIMALFAFTGTCLAQSDLVFFDAEGNSVGTLVQFVENSSCDNGSTENPLVSCNAVLRQGTTRIGVNLVTDELTPTSSPYDQSDLVYYDADGSRAGTLVQFVENSSCDNTNIENPLISCDALLSQGTSIIGVVLTTGEITNTNFRYQSDDCTGQPYVSASLIGPRGGMLLSKGDPSNPVLVEVAWYPTFANVTLRSKTSYNGLCEFSLRTELAMTPTIVDPANYGMKVIPFNGFKAIGFEGPLIPVNNRPNVIFRDGFESYSAN